MRWTGLLLFLCFLLPVQTATHVTGRTPDVCCLILVKLCCIMQQQAQLIPSLIMLPWKWVPQQTTFKSNDTYKQFLLHTFTHTTYPLHRLPTHTHLAFLHGLLWNIKRHHNGIWPAQVWGKAGSVKKLADAKDVKAQWKKKSRRDRHSV